MQNAYAALSLLLPSADKQSEHTVSPRFFAKVRFSFEDVAICAAYLISRNDLRRVHLLVLRRDGR